MDEGIKIDTTLSGEESAGLLLAFGFAVGNALKVGRDDLASRLVKALNKLMALSPNYIPYDENSFYNSDTAPLKKVRPQ